MANESTSPKKNTIVIGTLLFIGGLVFVATREKKHITVARVVLLFLFLTYVMFGIVPIVYDSMKKEKECKDC